MAVRLPACGYTLDRLTYVITARDPRTRPGGEQGERLYAPAEVLADWAAALRDDFKLGPGVRTLDASVYPLRTGHAHVCADAPDGERCSLQARQVNDAA